MVTMICFVWTVSNNDCVCVFVLLNFTHKQLMAKLFFLVFMLFQLDFIRVRKEPNFRTIRHLFGGRWFLSMRSRSEFPLAMLAIIETMQVKWRTQKSFDIDVYKQRQLTHGQLNHHHKSCLQSSSHTLNSGACILFFPFDRHLWISSVLSADTIDSNSDRARPTPGTLSHTNQSCSVENLKGKPN